LTEFTRAVNGIFTALYSLVTDDWSGFWGGLGSAMNAAVNGMLNTIEFFFGPEFRAKLVGAFSWAWQGVVDFWENTIAPALNTMREALPFGWGGDGQSSNLGIVNPANQPGFTAPVDSFNSGFNSSGSIGGMYPSQPAGGSYNINVGNVTVGNGGDPYDAGREVGRGVTDELRKRGG
jgi:hypothetical protein